MRLDEPLHLADGTECRLVRTRMPFVRESYVVVPVDTEEPDEGLRSELLTLAADVASRLADERLGDPGAFTILHSGPSTRRTAGCHVHVVLIDGRWRKAWFYFVLAAKNALQALGLRRDRRFRG